MTTTTKKPSRLLVLKDNHPTMQKLDKVLALMDELGISIEFSNIRMIVKDRDRDRNLPFLEIQDIEYADQAVSCFPPTTEFRVIYDNPAYLEAERLENEERERKRQAEAKAKADLAEEKRLATEAEADKRKERAEREALAKLKAKYPDG
jgi:hypothetical protein